ncbi:MAG: hypothetical protein ACR2QE_00990 [Acidimicrobiales bacterium]
MIYLQSTFDLEPATYATRDAFIDHTVAHRLAAIHDRGGELMASWFSNEVRFSRLTELWAFPDLAAFDEFRAVDDPVEAARLDELCPVRRQRLLEPLGPIDSAALPAAVARSAEQPHGRYSLAYLDVVPGRMSAFVDLLDAAKDRLAIIACLREVAGHPNRVLDIWEGDIGQSEFQANSPTADVFLGTLRQVAPDERIVTVTPLPYSPLR